MSEEEDKEEKKEKKGKSLSASVATDDENIDKIKKKQVENESKDS